MSEQNKEVALKFLEAMSVVDPETFASCLAPDAFTLTKGFIPPLSGERDGQTMVGMVGLFKTLFPKGLGLTYQSVIASGDKVVVEAEGNAITADDKPYCNQYCFVFTMKNGKIKQLNEYFCTKLASDVLIPTVERLQREAS